MIFISLDFRWGYNNVRIREGDKEKVAFITHKGLYKPTVMTFRLCNAPSTFQAMMNDILKEEIAIGHVAVYINNIIIFTDNLTLHHQLTEHVLEKLQKNNMFVKSEKCKFEQSTVEVLNLIVLKNSIAMNEFKVKSITI